MLFSAVDPADPDTLAVDMGDELSSFKMLKVRFLMSPMITNKKSSRIFRIRTKITAIGVLKIWGLIK